MSMENLNQSRNDFTQSIDRLEAQMSHIVDIVKDRNEKTLSNTFFVGHLEGVNRWLANLMMNNAELKAI